MPKKIEKNKNGLFDIKSVEIFSAGTWNGDEYQVQDLDNIIEAFKENEQGFRPPLKLGHDEKQKILQEDGYPAAGWVGNLYRKGEKLFADFVDIPKKVAELIKNKAYRKVSSEIYWNLSIKDKRYPFVLGAVALLGSDNPGVMNLDDILGMFSKSKDGVQIKNYANVDDDVKVMLYDVDVNNDNGGKQMPTIEELQAELKQKDAELKKFSNIEVNSKKKLDELEKQNKEIAEKLAESQQKELQADVKKFVAELKSEKLCTPAMEKTVEELLIEPQKKEYSLGEDKKGTKQEAIKELLKLFKVAAETNFEENTKKGDEGTKKESIVEKMEKEIAEYIKENDCDYRAAYTVVAKKYQEIEQ